MNPQKLNGWLNLLANLGVLVGIIFLIVEINQSNRLATQDAFDELSAVFNSMNLVMASDPEFAEIARIAASGELVEEDSAEFHQLRAFAWSLFNNWNLIDSTYMLGQFPEEDYPFWVYDVTRTFERFPGLAPHIEYIVRSNANVSGIRIEDVLESGYLTPDRPAGEAYLAMIRGVLGPI